RRWLWRGLPKPHPGTKPGAWLSGWLRAAHAFESGAKRRPWQKQSMRRLFQPVRRLRAISVAPGQTMGESAMAVGSAALEFTPDVEALTAPVWEKVRTRVTPIEWRLHAPLIAEISRLKREKSAVILAHNYMTPEIFHGVGDFVGDSLGLAREAAKTPARIIVQAGVQFMAETSKVLCPDKTVLIPDLRAGCSLAASITAADVRLIKERYPGVPVVTYVTTTAEVKAEAATCSTSANAVQVVEAAARAAGTDRVILLPDEFLARNVARQTSVRIVAWAGRCEVHERFDAEDIR